MFIENNVQQKIRALEQNYDFASREMLKNFAQVSELLNADPMPSTFKFKSADKMVMMPTLFHGDKPEKAKQHFEHFSQYIQFHLKNGNIGYPIKERTI